MAAMIGNRAQGGVRQKAQRPTIVGRCEYGFQAWSEGAANGTPDRSILNRWDSALQASTRFQPLVAGHFEAQPDLVEQSLLPLTAPGADLAAEHSDFAEQSAFVPQLFSPTAPGAAFAAEHSLLAAQQPLFVSPTAPGAALSLQVLLHLPQQSALLVPTAPGAVVFCVEVQAPRKAKAVRAARVAMVFM
jgi:hypothetical protein